MASTQPKSEFGSLYFPLASNAHSLLAGRPVESVRARMKIASLLYERVYLEAGTVTIQAGPTGSSAWRRGPEEGDQWQTARARGLSEHSSFSISIATDDAPGVPATSGFTEILNSPATIAWAPTFHPFRAELPATCNWVEFVRAPKPLEAWTKAIRPRKQKAMDDPALTRLIPVDFVRSQVVDNSSSDLGVGASGGAAVSMDSLHSRVISSRFAGDSSVHYSGFALPVLVPRAGALGWSEIADLRQAKGMARYRAILHEIEADAVATVNANDDLERRVEVLYRKRIIEASQQIESLGGVFIVGGAELVSAAQ